MAYSTWTSLSAALSRSPSLSQNLSNIEKWLIEFDPLFLEPVNSFPLQQLIRIKQTHSLQFQLHSRHSLIITAHKVYLRMLESHPDAHGNPVKSLQRYDRIYDIVKTIAPKYSIERIEFEKIFHEKLKETLNSSVTNAATKKSFQGYRKLFQDLGQNLTDFR